MIYLARDGEFIKIGLAVKSNIVRRWMELQIGNPRPIHMRVFDEFGEYEEEKRLHMKFQSRLVRGEWFQINDELEEMWNRSMELERKPMGKPPVARKAAVKWLQSVLVKSSMLASDIHRLGKAKGYSGKTLRRAADEMGVIRKREPSFENRDYNWRLP